MSPDIPAIVRPVTDPAVVRRQNELFDLHSEFVMAHEGELGYDPDDDPEFVARAREIMGLPPLA